ncbi:MAG: sulfotransferase [Paracoccaceae bacterium]
MDKSVGQLIAKAKHHAKTGNLDAARNLYVKILEKFPNNKRAKQSLLVLGLPETGQKELTRVQINDLKRLFGQGRLEELVAATKQLIVRHPKDAHLHNLRGLAFAKMQRPKAALQCFQTAIKLDKNFAEAHNNSANVLLVTGDFDAAVVGFERAIHLAPKYAEAYYNLGNTLQSQGKPALANESFQKAVEIKHNYLDAYLKLCVQYEKTNDISRLEDVLTVAVQNCGQTNLLILFFLAHLASRKENHTLAVEHLESIQNEQLPPAYRRPYFTLLGKSLDKVGRFGDAFSAFETQNRIATAEIAGQSIDAEKYRCSVVWDRQRWRGADDSRWAYPKPLYPEKQLTFLVGFPRSGTTLLDTILRSHPEIKVFEEKPLVRAMEDEIGLAAAQENVGELSESDLLRLQEVYFRAMNEHDEDGKDANVVIDKLPLNIRRVGFIHRVFPQAKFILAVRHPCDCVLSCFMQDFELNDAMANFLTLENSAQLYADIFELWSMYRDRLSLDVHTVKYEDLVQDMEGTCKPVIEFLGLNWDENLKNYQQTALDRGKIATPSYSQVVQPLYSHASGRWRHYEGDLSPILPVLQPWIDEFGYT